MNGYVQNSLQRLNPIHPRILSQAPLLAGLRGVEQTIQAMKNLAREASVDPLFRQRVAFVTRNCGNDFDCITESVERFIRREVRYLEEPEEILTDPRMLMDQIDRNQHPFGDCDDHALLAASMIRATGIPVFFVVIGKSEGNAEHVLISAQRGDKQAYIDTTQAQSYNLRNFKFQRAYPVE